MSYKILIKNNSTNNIGIPKNGTHSKIVKLKNELRNNIKEKRGYSPIARKKLEEILKEKDPNYETFIKINSKKLESSKLAETENKPDIKKKGLKLFLINDKNKGKGKIKLLYKDDQNKTENNTIFLKKIKNPIILKEKRELFSKKQFVSAASCQQKINDVNNKNANINLKKEKIQKNYKKISKSNNKHIKNEINFFNRSCLKINLNEKFKEFTTNNDFKIKFFNNKNNICKLKNSLENNQSH